MKFLPEVLAASNELKDLFPEIYSPENAKTFASLARKLGMPKCPYPPKYGYRAAEKMERLTPIHRNTILIYMWLLREEYKPDNLFNSNDMNFILSKSMRLCEAMIELSAAPKGTVISPGNKEKKEQPKVFLPLQLTTTTDIIEFMQFVSIIYSKFYMN